MNKSGYIVVESFYPIGSMSLRVRMWAKGFMVNNVAAKILVVAPPPTRIALKNSEDFVHFLFKPILKKPKINMLVYLFYRIIGATRLLQYLQKNDKPDFVLISRPNVLIGFVLLFYCRKNSVKFFFDKGDENARLTDRRIKSFIDILAKSNQGIFDKYVLPKVNVLFVVSSYLENKYKKKLPDLKIIRSLPTLLNFEEFRRLQDNDLFETNNLQLNVFNSKKIKLFYGGSCERTNGLFFFLEVSALLIEADISDFEIIFIFVDGDVNLIKEHCSQLNILDHVSFLSPVLPKYMPAIYKYIDILILPEQGYIIANAGFPGKVSEYMASGKAILSTIFSDLNDYLIHEYNALLSNIGDKESYFNNMKRLLIDKELRFKLGENAIKTAQNEFDYKQGMLRYIEAI